MFLHSDLTKGEKFRRSLSPTHRFNSPQPAVQSIPQNFYLQNKMSAAKKAMITSASLVDPFSRLCQKHIIDSNRIKVICDDQSLEYILGIRSIAKEIFYEEIPTISKAIYEEVVFRASSLSKDAATVRTVPSFDTNHVFSEIEKLLAQSFDLHKSSFIDPISSKQREHEERHILNEEKLDKLSNLVDMLASSQLSSQKETESDAKPEEYEQIITEIEAIKNELTERGNLYIRLCEELESDRLDNKLMKEELESEFNIIQQQFENFEKSLQEHVQIQISESIDFCVENMKNDLKTTKSEIEADHDSYDNIIKRRIEDMKKRMDTEYEDFDERISKINKEVNSRCQALTEKIDIDINDLRDSLRKVDDKSSKQSLNPLDAPFKRNLDASLKCKEFKSKGHEENNIISLIMNESEEIKAYPTSIKLLEEDVKCLKSSIDKLDSFSIEFKSSIEELYNTLKSINKGKVDTNELNESLSQIKLNFDKKISEAKLENIEARKKDMQKAEKGREEIIIQINEMYDSIREHIKKEFQSKKNNKQGQMLSPEKEFNLMFDRDPVKDLEKKVLKEIETLKQDFYKWMKDYIDGSIENSQINNQSLFFEIQNKYFDTFKTLVISEAEKQFIPIIKEEIRKEMCKIAFERETYNSSDNERSVALNNNNVKVYNGYQANLHNQMIIEESRENEDDSHQRTMKDPLTYSQNNEEENSEEGNYEIQDDSNVDDDIVQLSPPNKLPDSYVESRNSILPSEASSEKKENINIFDGSDSKFPDVNHSFQYQNNSQHSSLKKLQNYRNVSQKYLNTQSHLKLNESNVLRERLTDPNNVSNIKSEGSITISHHTNNHSNYESEKIIYSALKQNAINQGFMPSCIDIEKKRVNNENRPINSPNVNQLINYGSPISIFNQSKKISTSNQVSLDKSNQENMSLEDLISRIDSRREFFKKSVKEEFNENFVQRYKTPEFTDSPNAFYDNTNSHFLQQSTNDQISSQYNPLFNKSGMNPDSKDFTIFSNPAFGVFDSVERENISCSKEFNPLLVSADNKGGVAKDTNKDAMH